MNGEGEASVCEAEIKEVVGWGAVEERWWIGEGMVVGHGGREGRP